jgi:hypothetical protein
MYNRTNSIFYILIPALLLVALALPALINYPVVFNKGSQAVLMTFIGPLIYIMLWLWLRPGPLVRNWGLLVGLLFILNISIEDFIDWPTKRSALISTLVMMAVIFICFSIIGAVKTSKTKSFSEGVKASFTSALTGTLIAICFGFLICYLFEHRMINILKDDPGHENFSNPKWFIFFNAFDNASNHLVVVPVVSIIMGSIGGAIALAFNKTKRAKHLHPV